MRLLVRCCCRPQKVLGSLEVGGDPKAGQMVCFALAGGWRGLDGMDFERIMLPLAEFGDGQVIELAIKSEETPIATLRRIPGFIEAREP